MWPCMTLPSSHYIHCAVSTYPLQSKSTSFMNPGNLVRKNFVNTNLLEKVVNIDKYITFLFLLISMTLTITFNVRPTYVLFILNCLDLRQTKSSWSITISHVPCELVSTGLCSTKVNHIFNCTNTKYLNMFMVSYALPIISDVLYMLIVIDCVLSIFIRTVSIICDNLNYWVGSCYSIYNCMTQ